RNEIDDVLTWDDVERELARTEPARTEPAHPAPPVPWTAAAGWSWLWPVPPWRSWPWCSPSGLPATR
ncbi:MAG: hypothetical protein ACR2MO_16260, partial [Acidimicrobiales bacterium]